MKTPPLMCPGQILMDAQRSLVEVLGTPTMSANNPGAMKEVIIIIEVTTTIIPTMS